jgi:4'-phosphopantetheinyl transferase
MQNGIDIATARVTSCAPRWTNGTPSSPPPLHPGQLHVWLADLRGASPAMSHACLSEDETIRAQRFVNSTDGMAFAARRVLLRTLLGAYLQLHPAEVDFATPCSACGDLTHGKPRIEGPHHGIEFSSSSTSSTALIVVGRGLVVGADIEQIKPTEAVDELASIALSATEQHSLSKLTGDARTERFYASWTIKEAYLKAIGLGLSRTPASVIVSHTGEQATLRDPASDGVRRWRIACLSAKAIPRMGGDLAASVASDSTPSQVSWLLAHRP